ncbi:WD40-repeat-containing domain protein [Geranomyces variabilis]|nr:WD40-repeat-containing domain protein [Geranomyces variabilis]KAJ3141034.1 DNA excision repair protein ERCC-8 [Geranomyces variabilis]
MFARLLQFRETRPSAPSIPLHHSTTAFLSLRLKRNFTFEESGPVNALQIDSLDARYLLAACADSSVRLYDLEEEARVGRDEDEAAALDWLCRPIALLDRGRGHEYAVTGCQWFPTDNGLFTTSSMDGTVKVWDTNTMECACVFEIEQHVYDQAISPIAQSHNLIATGTEDQNVRLCDMRTGAFTHSMRGHRAPVLVVKWSPRDEYLLVSGSVDHTVRLWDVRKANACIGSLDQYNSAGSTHVSTEETATAHTGAVNGLAFTSDGLKLVTTGHDQTPRLWDMPTLHNSLANYGPHIRNKARFALHPVITPLDACSPPLLFHPSDSRQTVVLDLFTGAEVMRLKKHTARVACAALRGGGTQDVFSGGYDRQICWWTPEDPDA